MTGDDQALPWTGVFHFTFAVSLQVIGRPLESEWPSPFGPRNCGQLSLAHAEKTSRAADSRERRCLMQSTDATSSAHWEHEPTPDPSQEGNRQGAHWDHEPDWTNPSPGLRPPSPRHAGRGQGEGRLIASPIFLCACIGS